ncbi:MAG: hypothetical protein J6S71_02805 [Clostridia bacterium]|nr:hypothetical protein [Clostridia bacterium]
MPEKITMTPEDAAEIMRQSGIKTSAEAIRDGLDQGAFPFGYVIHQSKRNVFISTKKFIEWMDDFYGVSVVI